MYHRSINKIESRYNYTVNLWASERTINFYSSAPCARVKRFVMTRIYLENSQRYINQTIDHQLTRRNTTKIETPMRFMKIIRYFEYGSYLRSYEDYLRSENNARKRNSGLYGMTSAITMQRSNNWANKQTRSWSLMASSVHNCEDRFHIHFFICTSRIWFSYIYSQLRDILLWFLLNQF